ncbi:MAG: hypothetical protein KGQ59_02450 [Bdellovibrionales bacterium]|nr:hypothetical protein [Bdellovibrionales bacterium]
MRLIPLFSFLLSAWIGLSATPARSAEASGPFNGGGFIEIKITGTSIPGSLQLEYGRVDPINPISLELSQKIETTQQIPLMSRKDSRLLTLQGLKVLSSDGKALLQMSRAELDPARKRARTGATLFLQLSADGSGVSYKIAAEPREEYELVAPTSGPGLSFSESDLIDLLRLDDLEDSLLRIRAVSSTSQAFHQQLVDLAQKAPSIDSSRLQLLLDGVVFPASAVTAMKRRLRELPDNLENAALRKTLTQNLALAEQFAPLSNRLLMVGLVKIKGFKFIEAQNILSRIQEGPESPELAFQLALERLGGSFEALRPDEKLKMFSLAAEKRALDFAVSIGKDSFLNDSDKSVGALLDLVRQIPIGPKRDQLTSIAAQSTGPVNVAEFAALTAPIESDQIVLELYRTVASRITALTAGQVITLLSGRPSSAFRDQLILLATVNIASMDRTALRNLLLACSAWSCRTELFKSAFTRTTEPATTVVAEIILVLPAEEARDGLISVTLDLAGAMNTREMLSLFNASILESTAKDLLLRGLPKLAPFTVTDAVTFSDGLYKPGLNADEYRDLILIKGAESASDLSASNLDQLVSRASSDVIRAKVQQIGQSRIQKP